MGTTRKPSIKSTNGKGSPAKPISLYPMSEEEALQRLLRVPPPEKMRGEQHMSTAKSVGGQVVTNAPKNQPISLGTAMTITVYSDGAKQTHIETQIIKHPPKVR